MEGFLEASAANEAVTTGLDANEFDHELDNMVQYLSFEGILGSEPLLSTIPSDSLDFNTDCEPPVAVKAEADQGTATTEALTSGWTADCFGTESADDQKGKRRRRTRNAKQQELNRLAQQRYRQRKKEKYTSLQSTVDTLSSQLNTISILEKENQTLKDHNSQLQQQLTQKDKALQQAAQQLAQQSLQLKAQQEKLNAADQQLSKQQSALEQQQRLAKVAAELDPQALCERLLSIVKTSLAEVAQQPGNSPHSVQPEVLVAHLSRTLSSCCREIYNTPSRAQVAAPETTAAIAVSCC